MSKKIEDLLPEEDRGTHKSFIINPHELNYLRDLDNVFNSFQHYQRQLMSNYLKGIANRLGYAKDKNLEFTIDLQNDNRELTITEVPFPTEEDLPPLHKAG